MTSPNRSVIFYGLLSGYCSLSASTMLFRDEVQCFIQSSTDYTRERVSDMKGAGTFVATLRLDV